MFVVIVSFHKSFMKSLEEQEDAYGEPDLGINCVKEHQARHVIISTDDMTYLTFTNGLQWYKRLANGMLELVECDKIELQLQKAYLAYMGEAL
jgi:hypothetical protein